MRLLTAVQINQREVFDHISPHQSRNFASTYNTVLNMGSQFHTETKQQLRQWTNREELAPKQPKIVPFAG